MFQGHLSNRWLLSSAFLVVSPLFGTHSSYAGTASFIEASDLKLIESIDSRTALYKDNSGRRIYVRYVGDPDDEGDAGGTAFESVADVVASNIYATLVGEDVYRNQFIFSQQSDGQRVIWGVAIQPKDGFRPLWGPAKYPATPSNMERNAVIWRFLGMPPANEARIGFDRKNNLTRTDFDVAFTEEKQPSFNRFCIDTQLGILQRPCNLTLLDSYEKELLAQRGQLPSFVSDYVQSFRSIQNVTESLGRIKTFLENRLKNKPNY